RRSVLVGPADHEDVVALQPVVPGEDVGGDAEAGDVTDVTWPVRVRPRDRDEDLLRCVGHRRQLLLKARGGPKSYEPAAARLWRPASIAQAARETSRCRADGRGRSSTCAPSTRRRRRARVAANAAARDTRAAAPLSSSDTSAVGARPG